MIYLQYIHLNTTPIPFPLRNRRSRPRPSTRASRAFPGFYAPSLRLRAVCAAVPQRASRTR